MTQPTPYSPVNELLDDLLSQIQTILDEKLVGLYLYGSLVTGDFDHEISDIDLLAAVDSDINETEFFALQKLHDDIILQHRQWDERLEIAYLSVKGLQMFKTQRSPIAIISPGEPFHIKDAGSDWLMNWYMVREKGLVLFGPSPETIIAPISKDEFIQCVKDHALGWREWINDIAHRGSQAYVILTMCRALYSMKNGEQVSKLQAARWAEKELPEWAEIIQKAVLWRQESRREENVNHEITLPETRRFVHFMIDLILHI